MNTQNLTPEEVKVLHALLGKMIDEPKPKIYFDPVNQMVGEIMDNFDFIKVQTTMEALNWQWAGEGVPSISSLRNKSIHLLKSAAELRLGDYLDEYWEEGITSATGGFQAIAYCNENKTQITMLELKFVLTEWDSQLED
tara:strand:+ start:1289 stop:1705 length:417 start_codon:yes stop_codon:yes gene_type:complete